MSGVLDSGVAGWPAGAGQAGDGELLLIPQNFVLDSAAKFDCGYHRIRIRDTGTRNIERCSVARGSS